MKTKRSIPSELIKSFVCLLVASWTATSTAAVVTVGVGLFSLSPATVNIEEGDAVYWDEDDPDFGPYIITGAWGSIFTPDGIQFNAAGTYPYTAQSIFGGSWGGTVIVSPGVPNTPPTVTITSPASNSIFPAPASFTFSADAYDPDLDDIWDVEFWIGNVMVDDVYDPPYTTTVTNLAAGVYTLKAVVWDYSFATGTNIITITVGNTSPITLTGSALAAGKFRFDASGLVVGKNIVLQSSTNLASPSSWISVSTNLATSTTRSFTNNVVAGRQFFRLIQLP